jgi:hypothetical protein
MPDAPPSAAADMASRPPHQPGLGRPRPRPSSPGSALRLHDHGEILTDDRRPAGSTPLGTHRRPDRPGPGRGHRLTPGD